VWHPNGRSVSIRDYVQLTRERTTGEGGGVAIIAHRSVKMVHLKEFEVDGLEAIWAEVMVGKVRCVVGSVYIPPGNIKAIEVLGDVVANILKVHHCLLISMDANARNSLWDNSCIGMSHYAVSFKMGQRLEDIIFNQSLHCLNDGRPTYRSGKVATAPDVTVSKGITKYGKVMWYITDDDLRTPHECILIQIGEKVGSQKYDVIDWPKFNWDEFSKCSGVALDILLDKWKRGISESVDDMIDDLAICIQDCVDNTATRRTVTKHSKPWINPTISDKLKELRKLKRKYRHRKSPANEAKYRQFLQETTDMVKQAEHDVWLAECNKLNHLPDKQKWKLIHRLTNQQHLSGAQPLRILDQGQVDYLFEDNDIKTELENYHIRKSSHTPATVLRNDDELVRNIQDLVHKAKSGGGNELMNAYISVREVKATFGRGSDTPGPDGISARLIDRASREQMEECLSVLWNKSWSQGYFAKVWKDEDRAVIPKAGKDDYHDCGSYRTVSITSSLGKRFEYITSRRLIAVLEDSSFDPVQFAYLQNRSTTQALLVLVEKIKRAILEGKQAGVVFFDFADAFGSVNRQLLLLKLGKDFGISGKLFLHIHSFLSDRFARMKVNGLVGDWIQSLLGTSAGTILGPLLFISFMHDAPTCILPKFADDFVAVSIDSDFKTMCTNLQQSVDELVVWSQEWGMALNDSKTKVMVFGDSTDSIDISINGNMVEQVDTQKYLGVMLDQQLNFSLQADWAVSKVKRAAAKVALLYDGREGIPLQTGINLYKTLIRPHLEYAVPVWAAMSDKDQLKLEKAQVQCLKAIIGAKAHSSSPAVEVIAGIMPVKIRIRELCGREFLRIMAKDDSHILRCLMDQSTRVGLRFCPMEYIRVMSKQLARALNGCSLEKELRRPVVGKNSIGNITKVEIVSRDGSSQSRTTSEIEKDRLAVKAFVDLHQGNSVFVFTDGSVYGGPVGCGACAAVINPLDNAEPQITAAEAVGTKVDSTTCELYGIILGLRTALQYCGSNTNSNFPERLFVLCDSLEAVNFVIEGSEYWRKPEWLKKLMALQEELLVINVSVHLAWIPGHSGICANETADQLAKQTAQDIVRGRITAPSHISIQSALHLSSEIAFNSWQQKWERDSSGFYTRLLLPQVRTKVTFPNNRDTGVSYCRMLLNDTLLNEDSFRNGLRESPVCDCDEERETVSHFLLRCPYYEDIRTKLQNVVDDIWTSAKRKGHLQLSDSLLLAPTQTDSITKRMDKDIKSAFFQFIRSANRKI